MWVLEQDSNDDGTNLEGGEGLCEINNSKTSSEGATTSLGSRDNTSSTNSQQQRLSPLQYGDEGGWRLLRLLERELVHPTTFTQTFLQSILSSIESRDPVVSNAWLETLLDVIDLLPSDVIRNEILNVAVSKGQLSQPVASRVACCKLLGKIASKFEPYLIQQEVLPLLLSLCQDVNGEVRAGVCSQLPSLARGLGPELARPALLPSLVEMVSDEEPLVKLSAVQAVSDMLNLLDHESRQQIIVPLVRKLCEGALRSEDAVLLAVAKQLGLLCYSLGDQMSGDDRRWFIHAYQQMSQLGAPLAPPVLGPMPDLVPLLDRAELHAECRRLCAFNLPAMLVFGLPAEPEVLRRIFCELASDISQDVRRSVAASLHEVSRLLVAEGHTVRSQLVGLLCDSAEDVLESLVPHLGTTIENLGKAKALNWAEEHNAVLELCRALLHCEEEISQSNNWRLQSNMLEQLAVLTQHISAEIIFTHFVPRMFCKMHKARPLPCRVTAAKTLLKYLNHLKEEKQRSAVLARLNAEFLRSDSCYSRMLFLRMTPDAMNILSPAFFKQYLYNNVLTLAGDRVVNIQLEVCSLLCPLKQLLRLPHDRQLLHSLESCVGQLLLSAKDRDVNAALAMAIQQLDKIELPASSHLDNKVQQDPPVMTRNDVGRRSISAAHRLSTMGRSLDTGRSRLVEQDNRTAARLSSSNKPRNLSSSSSTSSSTATKPNTQTDTRIPLSTKPAPASISHIDPSTDEFYIDAGIRITPQQNNTKIPNLQDILHRKKTDDKVENIRSRLELNQITSKNKGVGKKVESRNILSKSLSRDSSPKPSVTMRNIRPTSATGQRKSLNLERNVTRRSLPPQDRMPTGRRNMARPQSCLIVEPKDTRKQPSTRSLSQENIPRSQSRIPKVNSPGTSRSSSPGGIEALKYSRKNEITPRKVTEARKSIDSSRNLELRLGKIRSTPVTRDPSPEVRDLVRKRVTQQRRPGPSYTAPSSRGSSPDSALHRLTLAPPGRGLSGRSMPSSPSSPIQGLNPPRQSSMPASPSSPLPPSRLPRYQYVSHDFG